MRRSRRTAGVGLGFALSLAAGFAPGCASARRGEAVSGPLPRDDARVARGEVVFMERCHKCHPGGEPGLGPGINDKPFPGFLKRIQVRQGLGAMPGFSHELISKEQLDDLMEYMRALRAHAAPGR